MTLVLYGFKTANLVETILLCTIAVVKLELNYTRKSTFYYFAVLRIQITTESLKMPVSHAAVPLFTLKI
jgi:hypothetical protein